MASSPRWHETPPYLYGIFWGTLKQNCLIPRTLLCPINTFPELVSSFICNLVCKRQLCLIVLMFLLASDRAWRTVQCRKGERDFGPSQGTDTLQRVCSRCRRGALSKENIYPVIGSSQKPAGATWAVQRLCTCLYRFIHWVYFFSK